MDILTRKQINKDRFCVSIEAFRLLKSKIFETCMLGCDSHLVSIQKVLEAMNCEYNWTLYIHI